MRMLLYLSVWAAIDGDPAWLTCDNPVDMGLFCKTFFYISVVYFLNIIM